ncbi:unnamed protein product [Ambrosiozyma monospora]|uniref:Unnamed protein product n=1 Tax=Ambrosiozyma monospora TaxID=43982 RepID=A0A9W6Z2J5_AMBMO|nr:unnamed protein product [Ambrosiozyma monospora]
MEEYKSLPFWKQPNFSILLNPCILNEALLCLVGVQPLPDFKVRLRYPAASLQQQKLDTSQDRCDMEHLEFADVSIRTSTSLDDEKEEWEYYSKLKMLFNKEFGGIDQVDKYQERFQPWVLDSLLDVQNKKFEKTKGSSVPSLEISTIEILEQIYYLCRLLLATSMRSKNVTWALANISFLDSQYRDTLTPYSPISSPELDGDRVFDHRPGNQPLSTALTTASDKREFEYEKPEIMAQSAELNNARLEDEIKDKTIQLNTLKEMVDDKVKRLQQLEAEKEELLNIINQLNKDQDLLKEELNACLITIDDLKNGLRQKSLLTMLLLMMNLLVC